MLTGFALLDWFPVSSRPIASGAEAPRWGMLASADLQAKTVLMSRKRRVHAVLAAQHMGRMIDYENHHSGYCPGSRGEQGNRI